MLRGGLGFGLGLGLVLILYMDYFSVSLRAQR